MHQLHAMTHPLRATMHQLRATMCLPKCNDNDIPPCLPHAFSCVVGPDDASTTRTMCQPYNTSTGAMAHAHDTPTYIPLIQPL